ncbi:MAG: acetyl-CoA carboxylase biotin carboxylase subunit [Acidimicrobiia bacterium]|nr:acetyl-CoA carboxylase biotin carboxylase subunit [Acidimicrobiia bacterium]
MISSVKSVLIANRGEIAVRVIRAAAELGLRTIAVYSELDRDAVHVELADEAWNIGPPPAAESYLDIERIIEVVQESGADAVHPGYGFLAENADFARAVMDAGRIWVGPSPEAIALMGDKISARRAAEAAGVPMVPGTLDPVTSLDEVAAFASANGFPLAIKAAAGGGGRGLKVVRAEDELEPAFESAGREAQAWFGNPEVYIERYLDRPRHIEAQVILDGHGNGVFLGERDCSIQRRHQKLIEETPAPGLDDATRAKIGEAAIAVAHAADYVNAGTVEFLLDDDGTSFYFLEMNTRIQVEHTITEMVTGIDLVKEQLRIAAGEKLSFGPTPANGHAIEFRINAEDASNNFLPNPGDLVEYREPAGLGVRVDSGVRSGSSISQYYDNMIAKLVVWGRDRDEAMARGRRCLSAFVIRGVETTIPAHLEIMATDAFVDGDYYTRYVEEQMDFTHLESHTAPALPEEEENEERSMTVEVGGRRYTVKFWAPVMSAPVAGGARPSPRRRPPKLERSGAAADGAGVVTAPMQGTIVKVHKPAGSPVEAGEPIIVLEAMKMENEIKAPADGEIVDLRVQPGDTVAVGAVLMVIK